MSAEKEEKTDNLEVAQKAKTQTKKTKQQNAGATSSRPQKKQTQQSKKEKENVGASSTRLKANGQKQPQKKKENVGATSSHPQEKKKTAKKQENQSKQTKKEETEKATTKTSKKENTEKEIKKDNVGASSARPKAEGQKQPKKEKDKVEETTAHPQEENVFEEPKYNNYSTIKTNSNKGLVIFIVIATIAIFATIFSTVFALVNINNNKIMQGISVQGIDISGLTIEEAEKYVKEITTEQLKQDINMEFRDYNTSINPAQIEFQYKINEAIEEAYKIGRNGNIIQNNYEILKTLISKNNIKLNYIYNDNNLNTIIDDIETKIPGARKQYSYYIEDGKLIITSGNKGIIIQKEILKEQIIESIQRDDKQIEIPIDIADPDAIDIEKIHSEIYTKPQNAYYTSEPYKLYPHVVGVDFAISIDQAKQILSQPQEQYSIDLVYTDPEITTNKIGIEAFPHLLSSFSTKYDVTNGNRSTNLRLAAEKINGTVLMPGEEFSYNKVVGERTISAGYKEAKIYSNGKVIDGLGGGICQISSTLYNAVLYANLEITERRNHQFVTSYIDAGLDATVVYGSTDFKFKNSREFPIKIVAEVKNGVAKMDIYGMKEAVEYEVRLEPVVINYIPYKTTYIKDSSLAEGTQRVEQAGCNGVKTVTYKYLFLNGSLVSKTKISNDTYNPMQKIVRTST